MKIDCCFCREFAGEPAEFSDLYPTLPSRAILETRNFMIVPSLGQLTTGHLLLIPRAHLRSFGELGSSVREEAHRAYEACRRLLSHRFSQPVCFEHGSAAEAEVGGCGVIHAHIHMVPMCGINLDPPEFDRSEWRELGSRTWLGDLHRFSASRGTYLYWHAPHTGRIVSEVQQPASQYLRRHVARALAQPDWDWRTAGVQPAFMETYHLLASQPIPASLEKYQSLVGSGSS